jgi:hypothetical protein
LANGNAELLRRMAWPGLTVRVEGEAPMTTATALTVPAAAATNAVKASLPLGVPATAAAVPAVTNTVSPPPL